MKWSEYFADRPEMKAKAQSIMMNYTREFDAAQGTNLVPSLWQQVSDQYWGGLD